MNKVDCEVVGDNDGFFEITSRKETCEGRVYRNIKEVFKTIDDSQSLSLDNEDDRQQLKSNILDRLEKLNEPNDNNK